MPDEEGRCVLPFAPVGKGRVRRIDRARGDWRWSVVLEAEVTAGAELVLDIP